MPRLVELRVNLRIRIVSNIESYVGVMKDNSIAEKFRARLYELRITT